MPSRAHELIARTDYRGIITTNYDRLLEITIARASELHADNVHHGRGSTRWRWRCSGSAPSSTRCMGISNEASSIVLTASDYDRMILFSPHSRSFLHGAMLNYTLLFVGYSLSDPDFQKVLVLRELSLMFQNRVPKHYALDPQRRRLRPGAPAAAAERAGHRLRSRRPPPRSGDSSRRCRRSRRFHRVLWRRRADGGGRAPQGSG